VQPDDAYWRRPPQSTPAADPAVLERPHPETPPPDSERPANTGPDNTGPDNTGPDSTRSEDSPWAGPASPGQPASLPGLIYHGPPLTTPPPAGWRLPHVVEPAPPRRLPVQDHSAIDEQEARARTLSIGFAIVAGAVILIALCAVCGRALF
jgi:hypothetical protein